MDDLAGHLETPIVSGVPCSKFQVPGKKDGRLNGRPFVSMIILCVLSFRHQVQVKIKNLDFLLAPGYWVLNLTPTS